jgi:hypothetical protein
MEDKAYRDIRVFRFRAPLIKRGDIHEIEFRADGPVPIYNDSDKIIGFGTVSDQRNFGMVTCAIDPANPERLDLEIGAKTYWLDAILEYRGFLGGSSRGFNPTIAYVKGLILTTTRVADQEPIDPNLAGLL